ncbi:MFS transporter [Flexibacterium corallicola]|uniref:MFS transporter n=1 Tax=Flexibacterium corallicola TaxID=3037259 RepID=UPI00286F3BC3|nr:MFS transporter [Pseudovibrio sp. M1P-2-3]
MRHDDGEAGGEAGFNSLKNKDSYLGGYHAWLNWALGTAFVIVVFVMQSGYAITNKEMAFDLSLTLTQVGLVGSVYTWVFAIAQICSGSMLDQLGTRKCLPLAVIVLSLGAFVFSRANGVEMLIAGQVLMALGASFGFIGAGFIGGQWFAPIHYGFMFALVQFAASIGALLGQRAISSLLGVYGVHWSELIGGIALCGAVVAIGMFFLLRDPPKAEGTREGWKGFHAFIDGILNSVSTVAAIRASWINTLIGGATFGSLFAIGVVWGPRLLQAGGMEVSDTHSVTSLCWMGLALGAPIFSYLSEKVGRTVIVMGGACLLQIVSVVAMLALSDSSVSVASVAFFLFGFGAGGSMLPYAIAAKLVPVSLVGTSAALVNAVQFVTGGLLMAIPGNILSGASNVVAGQAVHNPTLVDYQTALVVIPAFLTAAFILCFFLHEPGSCNQKKQVEKERKAIDRAMSANQHHS